MAKHVKASEIKRRMSNDLLSLAQILQNQPSAVVQNADVLKSSANQCSRTNSNSTWEYQVAGLQLRVNAPQNVLPKGSNKWLLIHIDLDLSGIYDESVEDCFTHLVLQIRIETEDHENICSWHFDRHITGNGEESEEAHPLYHFQHGGHAMKEISESLGKVLLLPAPRMAYPPMDAVLAIDFILSNFAGSYWQNLRNETTYIKLIREAQVRHWKPYVERLASWWAQGPKAEAQITALWPHLA